MNVELKFTGNIRRLRLRTGDTIIVEFPNQLGQTSLTDITRGLAAEFPENKVIVIGSGGRIAGVLRSET